MKNIDISLIVDIKIEHKKIFYYDENRYIYQSVRITDVVLQKHVDDKFFCLSS